MSSANMWVAFDELIGNVADVAIKAQIMASFSRYQVAHCDGVVRINRGVTGAAVVNLLF
jgi:hypothetical protein